MKKVLLAADDITNLYIKERVAYCYSNRGNDIDTLERTVECQERLIEAILSVLSPEQRMKMYVSYMGSADSYRDPEDQFVATPEEL